MAAGLIGVSCGPALFGCTTTTLNCSSLTGITTLTKPSGLKYSSAYVSYAVTTPGTAIPSNAPTVTGSGPITYTISPSLSGTGLSFDTSTGIISGTPSAAVGLTTYTVTATNSAGSTTSTVQVSTQTGFVVNDTGSGALTAPCTSAAAGCTMRGALAAANAGTKTIFVKNGLYDASAGTGTYQVSGVANLTISGESQSGVILSGGPSSTPGTGTVGLLQITGAPTVVLSNLTMTNGRANTGSGGGAILAGSGTTELDYCTVSYNTSTTGAGAIESTGGVAIKADHTVFDHNTSSAAGSPGMLDTSGGESVTMTNDTFTNNSGGVAGAIYLFTGGATHTVSNCVFTSNQATAGSGGAINQQSGTATVTGSTFQSNSASSGGGAIYFNATTPMTISSSYFKSNSAVNGGGALWDDSGGTGTLTISSSTFDSNQVTAASGSGGAISVNKNGTFTNLTFFGNATTAATSTAGALAIAAGATVTVKYSTFYGNSTITAASGGAIDCAGTVTVTNSLFAANLANGAAKNCRQTGVYNSGDYNFTDTGGAACGATAAHDFNAASTGVATALADNGGPVLTLALSSSSSARDAIPNASCGGVTTDARALTRPSASSTSCDVGAFEY